VLHCVVSTDQDDPWSTISENLLASLRKTVDIIESVTIVIDGDPVNVSGGTPADDCVEGGDLIDVRVKYHAAGAK
jgi:hypothetical protein